MIQSEHFATRKDGVVLNRTYSDAGFYIVRDGAEYAESIDPVESGREYTETSKKIEDTAPTAEERLAAVEALMDAILGVE